MKIVVIKKNGEFFMEGWYLKENESGFYVKMSPNYGAYFKFPWKLYTYKTLEKK